MTEFPSGWTFYKGARWPADPTHESLDRIDEAAVAPLPSGKVIIVYILLLGCDYEKLTRLNAERFPAVSESTIVGAPAIVYKCAGDSDETIAILPRDRWGAAHPIGMYLRDRTSEKDATVLIDTSEPRWLAEYGRRIMEQRFNSGRIALDSARRDD